MKTEDMIRKLFEHRRRIHFGTISIRTGYPSDLARVVARLVHRGEFDIDADEYPGEDAFLVRLR